MSAWPLPPGLRPGGAVDIENGLDNPVSKSSAAALQVSDALDRWDMAA